MQKNSGPAWAKKNSYPILYPILRPKRPFGDLYLVASEPLTNACIRTVSPNANLAGHPPSELSKNHTEPRGDNRGAAISLSGRRAE